MDEPFFDFFVRKMKLIPKSLIFSGVVSFLLQIRYFYEGYALKFVLEFLALHFIMLLIASWIVFRFFER